MALYTLCFPDRATAVAAAQALGFWDADVNALRVQGLNQDADGDVYGWMIDEIGAVVETDAVLDADGDVIAPATYRPGYWVNVTGQLPAGSAPALAAYLRPYGSGGRLFAGTDPEREND